MSKSKKSLLTLIHCSPLVKPGLFCTPAALRLAKRFMSEDLPTLGMPTIIVLIGCGFIPLAISFVHLSLPKKITAFDNKDSALLLFKSRHKTASYFLPKYSCHFLVCSGSAKSVLVRTISFFLFCVILVKFSLIEDNGARASKSSIITSTSLTLFSTSLRALFICPGNQ